MLSFRTLSLRRKQTLIIMVTSSVALLLACAAFSIYEVITFREDMVRHLSTLAEMVANNTSAALDFDKSDSAVETLSALQSEPGIIGASIYRKSGEVFANYDNPNDGFTFTPPALHAEGHAFERQRLILSRPISYKGETIGVVYLELDMRVLSSRLWRFMDIVGLVFMLSLLVAFALSSRLQRLVSDPILQLARVARSVALEKNYSVRATKHNNDELGQLVDGFNEMLAQIQQRDAALQSTRAELEVRVVERTAQLAKANEGLHSENTERKRAEETLRESEEKFRQLAANVTDVFYITSPDMQQMHYVSPAYEQIWGRSTESLYADPYQWGEAIIPEEREGVTAAFTRLAIDQPSISAEFRIARPDGTVRWILSRGFQVRDGAGKVIRITGIASDISERKRAQAELENINKQLVEASRRGGMAEIATNVLHNVGNVLNSVNVSASLVVDSVKKSRTSGLAKVVGLLREHEEDLGTFITSDPKGKQLPAYLAQLSEFLLADQQAIIQELESLRGNIEHIKEIVAMQQSYAMVSGVREIVDIADLVEDSLQMNSGPLSHCKVDLIREFENVPPMNVEKHKILQILVNLVRNATYACQESGRPDKRLTVRVANGDALVKISVIDNGIGIPPENLTRIFNHGFTTRKDGHGFGLHSGALAAKEIGGSLNVHSEGAGKGASFTLELPCQKN